MKEEPPELFSRSESKMPTTGSWSVRHHHIFNSSSAFLKSFQPCLYTFIVKQGQVIRKCMHRKKWRPAKKGIGRPITRCHCDFCNLWKRAQHGKHRFPILRGRNKLTKYSIYHQRYAGMTLVGSVNLTWKGWKWIEKFSLSTQGGGWGPKARVSKVIIASPCCVCCCSSRGNRGIELAPLLRKVLAPHLPLVALNPFYILYLGILTVKLARLPLPPSRESDVKRITICIWLTFGAEGILNFRCGL